MKTKRLLPLLLALALAIAFTGCTAPKMLTSASTTLKVTTPEGLQVEYSSPKDQDVEYDPTTGKFHVRSTSNEALMNSARAMEAESMKNLSGAVRDALTLVSPLRQLPPISP